MRRTGCGVEPRCEGGVLCIRTPRAPELAGGGGGSMRPPSTSRACVCLFSNNRCECRCVFYYIFLATSALPARPRAAAAAAPVAEARVLQRSRERGGVCAAPPSHAHLRVSCVRGGGSFRRSAHEKRPLRTRTTVHRAAAADTLGARATERLLGYLAEAARAPPRAVPLSQSSTCSFLAASRSDV